MRRFVTLVTVLASFVLVPMPASAQFAAAAIAGVVRDTSGAVLPGVTVEASSPALIEKVRSAVSDGTGQYRIVDLRAGSYVVTFTLPGFATVRREGVELTGSITATVNAELRVGGVEETITVTGEAPLVDIQSARRQETLSRDVIAAIPTLRSVAAVAVLVPGMTSANTQVGGLGGDTNGSNLGGLGAHGASDARISIDGQSIGSAGGDGIGTYGTDAAAGAAEVVVSTSPGSGEAEAAGPMVNVISRSGGNTTSGSFYTDGANSAMQGSNYTQALKDRGLSAPNELIKIWDMNGGLGGPIRKDRLWFFLSGRYLGNREYIAGMFYNKNAGDPTKWTYEPDLSRRAFRDYTYKDVNLRLTWQVTQRNKVAIYWDDQSLCNQCLGGGTATISPEANPIRYNYPNRVYQATWSAPLTNRILLEAGFSGFNAQHHGNKERDNNRDVIRMVEQAGLIPGLTYGSQNWSSWHGEAPRWRTSMSYVTGAHNVKIGYQGAYSLRNLPDFTNNQRLSYRFNNGVPNQLTMFILPFTVKPRTRWTALFAQDQWTRGRMTLQMGVRYDYANSFTPEQQVGPERFLPVQIVFPRAVGVKGFHDLTPRVGLVYDLFGNGKTALKGSVGRYVDSAGTNSPRYFDSNPLSRLATTTTRSWNDRNGNFVPDCDLLNPALNGECGAWGNQSFGQVNQSTTYDPALLEGWGVRPGNWVTQVGVQQQLAARISAQVEYTYRKFIHQSVTDNTLVGPSNYDPYSITAPVDARLPGGGGYPIGGLYDIAPTKFGATQNFITAASNFGTWNENWQGVDISVNVRLGGGLTAQGGLSTGRRMTDSCDVTPKVDNPSPLYCKFTEPFLTQVKGLAAYTIPKVDVQVSGTFQSRPGDQLAANYNVPTAVVARSLGRPLAGSTANVAVNLVEPGTLYGDRTNLVDFRVAKVLRLGGKRTRIGLDLYNALNTDTVQTYNQTYSPTSTTWLTPLTVLPARFAKISAQIDF